MFYVSYRPLAYAISYLQDSCPSTSLMVIYMEVFQVMYRLFIVSGYYLCKLLLDGLTSALYQPAVDRHDIVVPAQKTEELQKLFKNSKLLSHNEGKLPRIWDSH